MHRFRPVSSLHVDTIACTGYTSSPGHYWYQVKDGVWHAGDWVIRWRHNPKKITQFGAQATSDACWSETVSDFHLTHGLTTEVTITRVDLCRDVVGLPVSSWLAQYFAGTRGTTSEGEDGEDNPSGTHQFISSKTGNTLYIGQREGAACFLRLYEKHKRGAKGTAARLTREWKIYGWAGEDVTRVEYELKREGVQRAMHGRDVAWNDSLARIRLIVRPRHEYKRPSTARTHTDWRRLGNPGKYKLPPVKEKPLIEKMTRAADQAKRRASAASMALKDYLAALNYLAADGVSVSDGDMDSPDFEVRGKRGQVIQVALPVPRGSDAAGEHRRRMADLDDPDSTE